MKATCEETSSTVTKINIEIPEKTVQSMLDKRYRELTRTVRVAGFRKGKVPRNVIVNKYQATITSEVLNSLIPETISTAIKENRLRAVSQPVVDKVRLEAGQPLSFEATVEVIPKFRLKDFSDTELSCEIESIGDEAVDSAIERLRESLAVLETVGSRAVENGDNIVIDYRCVVDGQEVPKLTGSGAHLVPGDKTLSEELEEGIVGMEKGESKDITLMLPDNFYMKGIAGKEAVFTITVNEIKQKKLPELGDAFAKQVGKGDTLQELKNAVRADLETNNRHNAIMKVKQKLLEKLAAANPVDIPEVLKKAETERLLREHKERTAPGEDNQPGEEELRSEMGKQAVRSLSQEMIIDSFTEERHISLQTEELNREINRLAESSGEAPGVFSKRLKENDRAYANFEQRLLNEKTLDAMLDTIKVKEVFVEAAS